MSWRNDLTQEPGIKSHSIHKSSYTLQPCSHFQIPTEMQSENKKRHSNTLPPPVCLLKQGSFLGWSADHHCGTNINVPLSSLLLILPLIHWNPLQEELCKIGGESSFAIIHWTWEVRIRKWRSGSVWSVGRCSVAHVLLYHGPKEGMEEKEEWVVPGKPCTC